MCVLGEEERKLFGITLGISGLGVVPFAKLNTFPPMMTTAGGPWGVIILAK